MRRLLPRWHRSALNAGVCARAPTTSPMKRTCLNAFAHLNPPSLAGTPLDHTGPTVNPGDSRSHRRQVDRSPVSRRRGYRRNHNRTYVRSDQASLLSSSPLSARPDSTETWELHTAELAVVTAYMHASHAANTAARSNPTASITASRSAARSSSVGIDREVGCTRHGVAGRQRVARSDHAGRNAAHHADGQWSWQIARVERRRHGQLTKRIATNA